MDSVDSDYDMLDLLAFNCNYLTAQLRETSQPNEQEKIINDFLKKIDKEFNPISEIREGLFVIFILDWLKNPFP